MSYGLGEEGGWTRKGLWPVGSSTVLGPGWGSVASPFENLGISAGREEPSLVSALGGGSISMESEPGLTCAKANI